MDREGGLQKPIQLDVVSIYTANEEVNHSQDASIDYVSGDGRDLDVTFFPTWLQSITSKPVKKSWIGLFCSCLPVRDLISAEILERG